MPRFKPEDKPEVIHVPGRQAGRSSTQLLELARSQKTEITQLRVLLATIFSGEDLLTDTGLVQDKSMEPHIDFLQDTPEQIRLKILARCEDHVSEVDDG